MNTIKAYWNVSACFDKEITNVHLEGINSSLQLQNEEQEDIEILKTLSK